MSTTATEITYSRLEPLIIVVKNAKKLQKTVYSVPEKIDKEIARLKLKAMGIKIDTLSPGQKKYLQCWEMGT